MRKIKFRAWDKIEKEMLDWNTLKSNTIGLVNSFSELGNWSAMQFTGLHDRNGNEIYEGDILKRERTSGVDYDLVSFSNGSFVVCRIENKEVKAPRMTLLEDRVWLSEVIGNIHDDKSLLEGKNEKI